MSAAFRIAGCLALLSGPVGCATPGEYIPVESFAATTPAPSQEYVLQAGDVISVRVWNQDSISTRARIRPDGKISLPFLDDVQAAGSSPTALAKRIQARLKDFIVNPVATVALEEARPQVVAVLGEVTRAGTYPLEAGSGVLQALANAGGMTPFADRSGIVVIRKEADGGGTQRIRFTYGGLTQVGGPAASFRLQGGDVIVVE